MPVSARLSECSYQGSGGQGRPSPLGPHPAPLWAAWDRGDPGPRLEAPWGTRCSVYTKHTLNVAVCPGLVFIFQDALNALYLAFSHQSIKFSSESCFSNITGHPVLAEPDPPWLMGAAALSVLLGTARIPRARD